MSKEKSGVYLELFHGRTSPDEELADWGTSGPIFGPLSYVHTTYVHDIKLGDMQGDNLCDLRVVEDLVYYDGMYYGDWSVFTGKLSKEQKARLSTPCEGKATPPYPYTVQREDGWTEHRSER